MSSFPNPPTTFWEQQVGLWDLEQALPSIIFAQPYSPHLLLHDGFLHDVFQPLLVVTWGGLPHPFIPTVRLQTLVRLKGRVTRAGWSRPNH